MNVCNKKQYYCDKYECVSNVLLKLIYQCMYIYCLKYCILCFVTCINVCQISILGGNKELY